MVGKLENVTEFSPREFGVGLRRRAELRSTSLACLLPKMEITFMPFRVMFSPCESVHFQNLFVTPHLISIHLSNFIIELFNSPFTGTFNEENYSI